MEIMLETNKSESICGGIICFFQSPTFFREKLKTCNRMPVLRDKIGEKYEHMFVFLADKLSIAAILCHNRVANAEKRGGRR